MANCWFLLSLPLLTMSGPAPRLQDSMPVVTQEMVDEINSKGKWKASLDWVGNMTVGQARQLLGAIPGKGKYPVAKFGVLTEYLIIPESFNVTNQWPGCLGAIRDQGSCGSCYAFSATETLADRYCVDSGLQVVLSPQWIVSCDSMTQGCSGGVLSSTWEFLEQYGVPPDSCDPYISGSVNDLGNCSASCDIRYLATNTYVYDNPIAIQTALLTAGSIQTMFKAYDDFYSYKTGVYVHQTGYFVGWHAVKIVGWDIADGVNYWVVANSWGTAWGNQGFFFIEFGQCGIDSHGIAGSPVSYIN